MLKNEIKYLAGVGQKRANLLGSELGIFSFEDLLYYFPYKYIDRTQFYRISELKADLPYIQLRGKITSFETSGPKYKKRLIAYFTDGSGVVELTWFQGAKWIMESIKPGKEYIVFGKPAKYGRSMSIVHPEIEESEKQDRKFNASLQAVYSTTEKLKTSYLNSKSIHKLQHNLQVALQSKIAETLPAYLIKKCSLLQLNKALRTIHFPEDPEQLNKARFRLKFEELFYIQLNLIRQKKIRYHKIRGYTFSEIGHYFNSFYKQNLHFELTNAQKRVLKEIRKDVGSGRHMNRMLQGDVGSGKTLVALMAMLMALDNGFQACLMAPTEILAQQHYITMNKFLAGLNINLHILTGSSKKAEREKTHQELLSGENQLLVGTHALIEDIVQFKNLGIVIIDEQHRFGVAQRAKLWKKNIQPPHVLVMTATPIPRTLAMTLYGDLDVSVIDELPPGRKPVQTIHFFDNKRLRLFGFIKEQIKKGRQTYIVYPLITESEKMDYKDLEDGVESISRAFPSPEYSISVVHGKMKAAEKEKAMQLFVKGSTDIMVATTVIEVGVDVPNATVMVIESAERFGLSQLHQLRGRVGRGGDQSYCVLMTSFKLSDDGKKRIATMVRTNDGFEIAEADLQMRGPGDIEGTQQSGIAFELKIASLGKDGQILQYARNIAEEILEEDPYLEKPENNILTAQLDKKGKSGSNWARIS